MNLYFPAQSSANPSVDASGNWLLQGGRAITLSPTSGGQLAVANGQLWATLSDARPAWPQRAGKARKTRLERCATLKDYFLRAGDSLTVPPGAQVVIESTWRAQTSPAAFAWILLPQPARQAAPPRLADVVQAASELAQALAQVVRAVRRLAAAVLLLPKRGAKAALCL